MGLTNIFKREAGNHPSTVFYELLFCDNIDLYKKHITQAELYPWKILFSESCTAGDLRTLINDPQTESRAKILAYRKLLTKGDRAVKKETLGVIVEVGLDVGTDVLAAYKDGTARYMNQSGKIIILEINDERSDFLISELFYESESIVKQIGPWDKQERLAPPAQGIARITFLIADRLYFLQAPMDDICHDSLSGPALNAATLLMHHITEKALQRNQ